MLGCRWNEIWDCLDSAVCCWLLQVSLSKQLSCSPAGAGTNAKFLFCAHARSLLTPNWAERQSAVSICVNRGTSCALSWGRFLKTSKVNPVQVTVRAKFALATETRGFHPRSPRLFVVSILPDVPEAGRARVASATPSDTSQTLKEPARAFFTGSSTNPDDCDLYQGRTGAHSASVRAGWLTAPSITEVIVIICVTWLDPR